MPSKPQLAWSWTVVIMGLCWIPRFYLGKLEGGDKSMFVPNFDKLVHLGMFAVFAFLWMRVGTPGWRPYRIAAAGFGLATLTELGQELPIVSRDGNVFDGLADSLGVLLGLLAFDLVRRFAEARAVKTPSVGTP